MYLLGLLQIPVETTTTRQAAIAIEINPVDSAGSATKKRGIVVRSVSELDEFNRILSNQKLVELARKMDQVNPSVFNTSIIDYLVKFDS
jgi:hypothetical protein